MTADLADVEDVRYAYRLLLDRQPDPAGLETFSKLVSQNRLRPSELADYFLGSNEFRNRSQVSVIEIAMDGYILLARSDDVDIGKAAQTGRYEPYVRAALEEVLHPGDTFLDVGANIGYHTAFAAHRVGDGGRVFAFEPMDKNLQLLYATLQRNSFTCVEVYPFAASDGDRIVGMGTHANSSNGEIVREWKGAESPLFAQTRRLDALLEHVDRIHVVKFDIEGHELHAWRGFAGGLERHRPIVLTEFHPRCLRDNAGVDPIDYASTLLDYGKVTALHFDGARSHCTDAASVMRIWEKEDTGLKTDGAAHLDLFVQPRL